MPALNLIYEQDVERKVKCALLRSEVSLEDPWPEQVDLLQWALLEVFRGRLLTVPQLRFKFESLWKAHCHTQGIVQDSRYWNGFRSGNLAAKKIYLLIHRYEVIKPYMEYDLRLDGKRVRLEYAVLASRVDKQAPPVVLVERRHRPEASTPPYAIEMLRAYHLLSTSLYPQVRILNFPLGKGKAWMRASTDLALVRRHLSSMLNHVMTSEHPSPGGHCKTCIDQLCRKAFSE